MRRQLREVRQAAGAVAGAALPAQPPAPTRQHNGPPGDAVREHVYEAVVGAAHVVRLRHGAGSQHVHKRLVRVALL